MDTVSMDASGGHRYREISYRKYHERNNEPPNTTVMMMQRTTMLALVRRLVQRKRFKRENVGSPHITYQGTEIRWQNRPVGSLSTASGLMRPI